jgi:acetoin utilization transport system permease protein
MKLKDQFRFVRQNMKKNRTRVFMTILATAMGCAFLIVLSSVGFGFQKSIVKDITERQVVTAIDIHGKQDMENGFTPITDTDIKALEKIKNVKAVTRRKILQQNTQFRLKDYQIDTQTIIADFPSEMKAEFKLSSGHLPKKSDEMVVGYDFLTNLASKNAKPEDMYDKRGVLKDEYRYTGELIGQKLELPVKQNENGKEIEKIFAFTITGIGVKPTKKWIEDRNAYISNDRLKEIEAFTGTPKGMLKDSNLAEQPVPKEEGDVYDEVKVYAKNMEAVKNIDQQLKDKNYETYSVLNELKEVNLVFLVVKAGLIFIGTIAILIASIGIYNTMTMAVTERAPDIGIMKAIGANPKTIRRIFLLESSYIGLIGALIGTVVSYIISYTVNFALPLIIKNAFGENAPSNFTFSDIPVSLPLICIVICYGVTIISGLRPAQRATRVDVLKAMRREV